MSFDMFKYKVKALVLKAGVEINVRFFNDTEMGRFVAKCDDVTLIGSPSCLKIAVKWGSGHYGIERI